MTLVSAAQLPAITEISRALNVGFAARLAARSNNVRNLGVFGSTLAEILNNESDDAKRGMLLSAFVSEMTREGT